VQNGEVRVMSTRAGICRPITCSSSRTRAAAWAASVASTALACIGIKTRSERAIARRVRQGHDTREAAGRARGVKVEGRKSHAELHPGVVAEAERLRRRRPKGGQRSLRQIASELFKAGYANSNGRPFSASSVKAMIEP
jgi:hypothetical protein